MAGDAEYIPAAKQLEILRDAKRSDPIHPMEWKLLWVLGGHLCLMAWALGTVNCWSQIVSLGMSVFGLWLAVTPREIRLPGGGRNVRASLWPRLIQFPLFWLGIVLLVYVAIQGLNPSWGYENNRVYWYLRSRPYITWLPTGIEAPFFQFNVWRQFIIYADVWLLVCTVWAGLTRRRSLRVLLIVLAVNALALSLFLVFERAGGIVRAPEFIYGPYPMELTSSFTNRNLAGEYFSMLTFAAVALATWYFEYGRRRFLKSTPSGVWGLAAVFLAGTVFFTLSRGAVLSLATSLVLYGLWIALRRARRPAAPDSNPALTATVAMVFLFFAVTSIHYLDFSDIFDRFNALATKQGSDVDVSSRMLARSAAEDMYRDHGLQGVGAGSFRYLFTEYVKNYPEIYERGTVFWWHAHCDWLEIPIELGLAGTLLLAGGFVWGAVWFIRHKFIWHSLTVPILLGCLATLIHAGFDFPFQCPAILATWCVLIVLAARWIDLETKVSGYAGARREERREQAR